MKTAERAQSLPFKWTLALLVVLSVLSIGVACGVGAVPVPLSDQVRILRSAFGGSETGDQTDGLAYLYLSLRLPRVASAYLIGMALACVGALFQALLRNPLAEPYIIGVSPGASLGVTVFLVLSAAAGAGVSSAWLLVGRTAFAFLGGLLAVIGAYMLASRGRYLSLADILLAGIAIGALTVAVTSYLWIRVLEEFRGLLYWLMGNLQGSSWSRVGLLLLLTVPVVAICWRLAQALNLMLLGEEHATYLGLDVERFKRWMLALGTLAAAGTVAVAGVIGFVGIIVPHIVRRLLGADNSRVVPASSLAGGVFLVGCDLVARTVVTPLELPVGMLTALVGGPFFLYVLRRRHART